MSGDLTLQDQITEVELHALGLRDIITRAAEGKIKRSPHEIDRLRDRFSAAEAAAFTLRSLSRREQCA